MNKVNGWVKAYILFVLCIAVLLFILSYALNIISNISNINTLIYSFVLIISIILANKYPIDYFPEKENQAEITLSLSLSFVLSFILPPFYAIITTIIANILSEWIIRRREFFKKIYKVIFNSAYLAVVTGITSLVFYQFYDRKLNFFSSHNIFILLIGGLVYFFSETSILFGLLSRLNNQPFIKYWIKNIKAIRLELLTLFPLGYLLIYLYLTNFWISILLIPLFVAIYFASKEKIEIIQQTEKTLYVLAKIEDDKTPDTMRHSERVANLVERLCTLAYSSKISEDERDIIVKAARLHDIGKVAISDKILEKKGKLTDNELKQIRTHPQKGKEIVEHLRTFGDGPEIILHHHERWDGKGYPDGLKGEEIPLGSRIICVADSFDAMISKRPYKAPKSIREALDDDIHGKNRGKQFDPYAADAFYDMVNEMLKDDSITENPVEWEKYFPKDALIYSPKTKEETEK